MSTSPWSIRYAKEEDLEALVQGNCAIALETEGLKLDQNTVREGVMAVLQNPTRGFYIVVLSDGEVVGQMMITFEWSDWRNGCFWWIQSVHVASEFRHKGLFKALYAHILEEARKTPDICGLRLYVERENEIAQWA